MKLLRYVGKCSIDSLEKRARSWTVEAGFCFWSQIELLSGHAPFMPSCFLHCVTSCEPLYSQNIGVYLFMLHLWWYKSLKWDTQGLPLRSLGRDLKSLPKVSHLPGDSKEKRKSRKKYSRLVWVVIHQIPSSYTFKTKSWGTRGDISKNTHTWLRSLCCQHISKSVWFVHAALVVQSASELIWSVWWFLRDFSKQCQTVIQKCLEQWDRLSDSSSYKHSLENYYHVVWLPFWHTIISAWISTWIKKIKKI